MRRILPLMVFLVLIASAAGTAERHLIKQPKLPIDCNSFSQPCTGSVCELQQTTYICDGVEYPCQNDTQVYRGGNQICCTGKNFCFSCQKNGRTYNYYNYNSNSSSCTPNP